MVRGNFNNPLPAFRRPDHAADRGKLPGRKIARGHTVRGDHEVFDDLLCAISLFHFERLNLIAVKHRFGLNGFQTQRPVNVSKVLHTLGGFVLQAQAFLQPRDERDSLWYRFIPIQPCGNTVIGQFGMIADTRPDKFRNSEEIHLRQFPFQPQAPDDPR